MRAAVLLFTAWVYVWKACWQPRQTLPRHWDTMLAECRKCFNIMGSVSCL